MVDRQLSTDLDRCLSLYEAVHGRLLDLDDDLAWNLQGCCSLALAEARLHLLARGNDWLERSRLSLDRALRACVASESFSIGLHQGLSGLGWTALLANRLLEPEAQFDLSDLDEALVDHFSRPDTPDRNLDFVIGSSGCVVYALAHPDPEFRSRIFDGYATLIGSRLSAWKRPVLPVAENREADQGPGDCLSNCGLAHGTPGILAVLARIVSSGYRPAAIVDLLRQATAFCVADIHHGDRHEYVGYTRDDPTPSRSAWCYGEPGFAAALAGSAEASGDEALKHRAIDLFCSSILQKDPEKRVLDNVGICHGWGGILLASRYFSDLSSRPDARLEKISALASAEIMQAVDDALIHGRVPVASTGSFHEAADDLTFLCGALGVLHVLLDGLDGRRKDRDLPWADCLVL